MQRKAAIYASDAAWENISSFSIEVNAIRSFATHSDACPGGNRPQPSPATVQLGNLGFDHIIYLFLAAPYCENAVKLGSLEDFPR
jgi:hypothetical protein